MGKSIKRFEDLIAWQKARALVSDVYRATAATTFSRDFALCNQIRKAAISIPCNIAEGFERGRRAEFNQFLSVAKASCAEVRTQIYIAGDVEHIDGPTRDTLLGAAEEVARIIGGLRAAVSRTQYSVLSTHD